VQVLVSTATAHWFQVGYPETIRIRADHMNGLAKSQLDLGPLAVELKNLQWLQGRIRSQQEYSSTHQVVHDTKSHDASDRSPHQIEHAVAHRDIALAVDWTGGAY